MKMKSVFTDMDLACKLAQVETGDDLEALGFKPYKRMNEIDEYKDKVPDRIWITYKELSDNELYIIAICDNGNDYYDLVYTDVPVQELLKD